MFMSAATCSKVRSSAGADGRRSPDSGGELSRSVGGTERRGLDAHRRQIDEHAGTEHIAATERASFGHEETEIGQLPDALDSRLGALGDLVLGQDVVGFGHALRVTRSLPGSPRTRRGMSPSRRSTASPVLGCPGGVVGVDPHPADGIFNHLRRHPRSSLCCEILGQHQPRSRTNRRYSTVRLRRPSSVPSSEAAGQSLVRSLAACPRRGTHIVFLRATARGVRAHARCPDGHPGPAQLPRTSSRGVR